MSKRCCTYNPDTIMTSSIHVSDLKVKYRRPRFIFRGRATERQDHHIPLVQHVAEGSEELRLALCRMVGRMLLQLMSRGTIGVLRPYLDDTIMYLVSQSRDAYPTVKVEALSIITKLAIHPHLEQVRLCFKQAFRRTMLFPETTI